MGMIYEMTTVDISRNALVVSIRDLFIQMLRVFICRASAKRTRSSHRRRSTPSTTVSALEQFYSRGEGGHRDQGHNVV